MKRGLDWYQREPVAWLGGVQGMTAREIAVYDIVVDLIYLHGGSINNDPGWIAGWISDMGKAAVRRAIESLVKRGKLTVEGGQITQKRAKNEAKTKEKLRETRAETGKKGGVSSGFSRRRSNENNGLTEANASPKTKQIREDKRERGESPSEGFPSLSKNGAAETYFCNSGPDLERRRQIAAELGLSVIPKGDAS